MDRNGKVTWVSIDELKTSGINPANRSLIAIKDDTSPEIFFDAINNNRALARGKWRLTAK